MIAPPLRKGDQQVWLFTRGAQSVRLLRQESTAIGCVLVICGPGNEKAEYTFNSLHDCMTEQPQIEQRLMAEGFAVARIQDAERRRTVDPRRDERRRQ